MVLLSNQDEVPGEIWGEGGVVSTREEMAKHVTRLWAEWTLDYTRTVGTGLPGVRNQTGSLANVHTASALGSLDRRMHS